MRSARSTHVGSTIDMIASGGRESVRKSLNQEATGVDGPRLKKSIVSTIIQAISARNRTSVSRRTSISICCPGRRAEATGVE